MMAAEARSEAPAELDEATALEQLVALPGVGDKIAGRLVAAGFRGLSALAATTPEALQEIEGIGPRSAEKILHAVREALAPGTEGSPAAAAEDPGPPSTDAAPRSEALETEPAAPPVTAG
jgi:Holliday junction resolvasome RuvABC DNA-binding subunit